MWYCRSNLTHIICVIFPVFYICYFLFLSLFYSVLIRTEGLVILHVTEMWENDFTHLTDGSFCPVTVQVTCTHTQCNLHALSFSHTHAHTPKNIQQRDKKQKYLSCYLLFNHQINSVCAMYLKILYDKSSADLYYVRTEWERERDVSLKCTSVTLGSSDGFSQRGAARKSLRTLHVSTPQWTSRCQCKHRTQHNQTWRLYLQVSLRSISLVQERPQSSHHIHTLNSHCHNYYWTYLQINLWS